MANLTCKDHAIIHMVLFILYQIPIIPTDDYSIRDTGPHRLYTFHADVRDDMGSEELAATFEAELTKYRAISDIKPLLYEIEEYPGSRTNFYSVYITLCV